MPLPLLAALAIPSALSGIAGLFGARKSSKASTEAARIQSEAGRRAGERVRRTSGEISEDITAAGTRASEGVTAAGERAATDVTGASTRAAEGVRSAAEGAATGVETATGDANEVLRGVYEDALGINEPFREGGVQAFGTLAELGQNPEEFEFDDTDPAFQFRLEQGRKAILAAQSATGNISSGGTLKSLERFSQGLASTEIDKAFNRFDRNRNYRADLLSRIAGFGERATTRRQAAGSEFGG